MEATKNLCVQIPLSLHARIRAEQEKSGETLSAYITTILTQYYEEERKWITCGRLPSRSRRSCSSA